MYCRCFLLLLTLFAATVISQDGDEQCLGAFVDLAANGPCNEANEKLNDAIDYNTTISTEILNAFCTPSCRALYNRALSVCADLTDASRLYCTVYEGVSCYDVTGPTFQVQMDYTWNSSYVPSDIQLIRRKHVLQNA